MRKMSENLSSLRQWLLEGNFEPIIVMSEGKKRVLSFLTALTYDKDATVSDNAIKAMGLAAKSIAKRDPEYIRNYLLRLFWLVNDESGGIGWRAPEMIGEILYNCPRFVQFFPLLISLLDLETEDAPRFRTGTLWAIGRVAQVNRRGMLLALPHVQTFTTNNENTNTKEMAVWCVKQLTLE